MDKLSIERVKSTKKRRNSDYIVDRCGRVCVSRCCGREWIRGGTPLSGRDWRSDESRHGTKGETLIISVCGKRRRRREGLEGCDM